MLSVARDSQKEHVKQAGHQPPLCQQFISSVLAYTIQAFHILMGDQTSASLNGI